MEKSIWLKILAAVLALVTLAGIYWFLQRSSALTVILDGAALRAWIIGLGVWGPLAIIGLMILAILLSPIPSAPIAVAAGAAYGHVWGAVYVLIGAEVGAIAAFGLARLFGHDVLRHWFGDRLSVGLLGSQNGLMGIVFISRLLPFISFDIVSYAAGLTVLAFWRFVLATLAGIIPASFLLAYIGDEMVTGDTARILIFITLFGVIMLIPVGIRMFYKRRDRRKGDE